MPSRPMTNPPPTNGATTRKPSPSPTSVAISSPPRSSAPVPPTGQFEVETPSGQAGQRILAYGPGGVGKSTLASMIDGVLFFDLDGTVSAINNARAEMNLPPIRRVNPAHVYNWKTLRQALHTPALFEGVKAIVIDSAKPLQEWALAYTLETVRHEKGHAVSSIEDYGYGKGWQFVYDTFVPLLGDLDIHAQAGRHVIIISHAVTDTAPNPFGEDYQRYEPDLNKPPKVGRIRDRVIAWADHVLFATFDVFVNEKGKGTGGSTRTIYPMPMASHIAKTRSLRDNVPYDEGSDVLWQLMGINQPKEIS